MRLVVILLMGSAFTLISSLDAKGAGKEDSELRKRLEDIPMLDVGVRNDGIGGILSMVAQASDTPSGVMELKGKPFPAIAVCDKNRKEKAKVTYNPKKRVSLLQLLTVMCEQGRLKLSLVDGVVLMGAAKFDGLNQIETKKGAENVREALSELGFPEFAYKYCHLDGFLAVMQKRLRKMDPRLTRIKLTVSPTTPVLATEANEDADMIAREKEPVVSFAAGKVKIDLLLRLAATAYKCRLVLRRNEIVFARESSQAQQE